MSARRGRSPHRKRRGSALICAVLVALALPFATGCGAGSGLFSWPSQRPSCLDRSVPKIGRARADTSYAYLRARWDSLDTASPLVRAAWLPEIPRLIPDASDLISEPACAPDLLDHLESAIFTAKPLPFSALLLGQIRAVARVQDTTDVMTRKAAILIRLARLEDREIGEYIPALGEPAQQPPSRSLVRLTVIAGLAGSNLWANDAATATFLRERLALATDPEELLALLPVMREGTSGAVLRRRLDDARSRLETARDPASFELVWHAVQLAGDVGGKNDANELFDAIRAKQGRFPLTSALPGAAEDLWIAAERARILVAREAGASRSGWSRPPARRSKVYQSRLMEDRWLAGVRLGTATSPESERLRAEQAASIDSNIDSPAFASLRCSLLRELARWSTPAEMESRLERRLPAVTGAAVLRVDSVVLCATELLGSLEGADEARRIGTLLALERWPTAQIQTIQAPASEGWSVVTPLEKEDLRDEARRALLARPSALMASPVGRAWLEDLTEREPVPGVGPEEVGLWHGSSSLVAERAPDTLLGALAVSTSEADGALGKRILVRWMAMVDQQIAENRSSNLWTYQLIIDRIYEIARFAPAFGLTMEASAFIERVRAAAVVAPLFGAKRIFNGPVLMSEVAELASRIVRMGDNHR